MPSLYLMKLELIRRQMTVGKMVILCVVLVLFMSTYLCRLLTFILTHDTPEEGNSLKKCLRERQINETSNIFHLCVA